MTTRASIAIGVPTYNRKAIIELCAHSVRLVDYPEATRMIVVDDASVEFDETFLRDQYPPFAEISRREVNSGGADVATPDLLARLIDTGADILMIIDSDLILKRDCLRTMLSLIDRTEGLLSLFNTPNHWALRDKGDLLQKRTIGAAATAWRRDLAVSVLRAVEPGSNWDWRVCEFLRERRTPIFTVKESLVQHLGFGAGENSHALRGDVGLGYYDDDFRNAYSWINEVAAAQQNSFTRVKLRLEDIEFRLSKLEKYSLRSGFRAIRDGVRALVTGRTK